MTKSQLFHFLAFELVTAQKSRKVEKFLYNLPMNIQYPSFNVKLHALGQEGMFVYLPMNTFIRMQSAAESNAYVADVRLTFEFSNESSLEVEPSIWF